MTKQVNRFCGTFAAIALCCAVPVSAQRGFGGGGGGFGRGGMGQTQKILATYDKNGDGWLNAEERKTARASVGPSQRGGRGGFGGGGGTSQPGARISPADVKVFPGEPLYSMKAVRTLFLQFENEDWEQELAAFNNTDVEVPATLTVDGQTYKDVGVHFRGNTSYMGAGRKNSLNLSLDFRHKKQRLMGYRTLNLMNSASDPSLMRIVLYHEIARQYFPAPKANWVRVAINGENWGVYVNLQQINSEFTEENFKSTEGTRWKLPVNMGGGSGFAYVGESPESYKRAYEIKSKDDPKAWAALVNLCKVLSTTAPEKLEQALEPVLDIDAALRFLAIDKALINNDGYWTRASDFTIYLDPAGRFHIIPSDANETLREVEGGRGGFGGVGVELDPFAGSGDASKPLLNRLMAVPALRQRYLGYLREIAERSLDWSVMGPKVAAYQSLIQDFVKEDTRSLSTYPAFVAGVGIGAAASAPQAQAVAEFPDDFGGFRVRGGRGGGPGGSPRLSLKEFFDQRRAYLLEYPAIKALAGQK